MSADKPAGALRVAIRVRPGASRPAVGGERAGALLVAVSERAVDGKATAAALRAVADALGVAPRTVRLAHGATSRDKLVEVEAADAAEHERITAVLRALLDD